MRGGLLAALILAGTVAVGCSQASAILSTLPSSPPETSQAQTREPQTTPYDTPEPTEAVETQPTDATPPDSTPGGTATSANVDLARLATGETPAGWQEILSGDGKCRMAVPGDWITGVLPGTATGSYAQSILANDGVTDFKTEIAHLKATYFGELNDSANEVLIEDEHVFVMRETVHGGASFVISLNAENTACGIITAVDEVAADDLRPTSVQILYTLAEKK
jgi:hypothetical protein